MNIVKPWLILLAGWIVSLSAYSAQHRAPGEGPVLHGCKLLAGGVHDNINLGNIYVPADLPIGSVIGTEEIYRESTWSLFNLTCYNGGIVNRFPPILFSTTNLTSIDPISGTIPGGHVLRTNIPGVGVRIKIGWPWAPELGTDEEFTSDTGEYFVPYKASNQLYWWLMQTWTRTMLRYTLIKTGDIGPVPQSFDASPVFNLNLPSEFSGPFAVYGLTGTVTQAQCSLGGNPVSANPVNLGDDWTTSQFTREGYTTAAVPFTITLLNCQDNDPDNQHRPANIDVTLDAVYGEANAVEGVANLAPGPQSAAGMGVQILMADGITPMPLNTEIQLVPITLGTTVLNFQARYYQTGPAADVLGGEAKSSVNYTITYK